jgi:hypothetical protein
LNGVSEIRQVTVRCPLSVGLEESEKVRTAPHGSSTPGSARRIACWERYRNPVPSVEKSKLIALGETLRRSSNGTT